MTYRLFLSIVAAGSTAFARAMGTAIPAKDSARGGETRFFIWAPEIEKTYVAQGLKPCKEATNTFLWARYWLSCG